MTSALLALALGAANLAGMNVGSPTDYDPWRMYADVARVMRVVGDSAGTDIPAEDARIDSTGLPLLSDFYLKLAFDPTRMDGRYRIRLGGKITGMTAALGGTVTPTDASGNDVGSWASAYVGGYTYARFDYPTTTGAAISLHVTGGYRDAGGTQPGISSFYMMRPVTPGSTTSYAPGTLFTNEALAFASHFDVLRWMGFLGMNGTQVKNWIDRGDPRYTSQAYQPAIATVGSTFPDGLNVFGSPGRPGSYEDIIRFSNAAGVDAWINIPIFATDDFMVKLAQLFKCGSDGMSPWVNAGTDTCAAGTPTFPPLDAGRKLYVEFSNEVWNFGFSQYANAQNRLASLEPDTSPIWHDVAPIAAWSAGTTYAADALVRYSGQVFQSKSSGNMGNTPVPLTDGTYWRAYGNVYRWIPMQTAKASLAFRRVFGDAAMMTRIRPVLSGQSAWVNGPQGVENGLAFMFDYFSNGRSAYVPNANWTIPGTSTQVGPQPISYYLWGAGGAAYYTAASTATTVADLLTSGEFTSSVWSSTGELQDTAYPPLWGLPRVAYEGGPNYGDSGLASGTPQTNAGIARYTARPASPNMTDVLETHHDVWSGLGGGLLVYLGASSAWQYGGWLGQTTGTDGIFSYSGVPQMVALDELRARSAAAITAGQAIPGTRQGNGYAAYWSDGGCGTAGANSGSTSLSATGNRAAGYLYRADSAFTGATVALSKTGTGTAKVYVDGVEIAGDGTTFSAGSLAPGLHGVIVRASSGSFTLTSVTLNGTATGAVVTSIAVSPSSATVTVGGTQSYTCTAYWSDTSTSDCTATASWSSSATGVATMGGATATGVGAGTTTIQASYGGQTATAALTVTTAAVHSTRIKHVKLKGVKVR